MEPRKNKDASFRLLTKTKKTNLLKAGTVTKAHGIRGEIFVRPFHPHPDWPSKLKEIFIGEPPKIFEVESHRPHKQGWIFKLKGCDTRNESEVLRKQPFFLSKTIFKSQEGEFIYLAELTGFSVEIKGQTVGHIQGFSSNGVQDYLEISTEKSPLSVPFISDYIEDVNFTKRHIKLLLPSEFPGLADE